MDKNLPDSNKKEPDKKKNSFWKKWNEWWRLTWESFVVEIEDRVLMSWKRLIKFVGIVIIPIIYGVICSVAFWNPIQNIGRSELIVMDNDYSVLMVTDVNSNNNNVFQIGTVKSFAGEDGTSKDERTEDLAILLGDQTVNPSYVKTGLTADDIEFLNDEIPNDNGEKQAISTIGIKSSALKNDVVRNSIAARILNNLGQNSTIQLSGLNSNDGDITYNPADSGFKLSIMSMWEVIKMALNPKEDLNVADKDYTFSSPIVNKDEGIALTNIKYSSDVNWNNKHWQKHKGYMQLRLPEWYTARLLNYISLFMNNVTADASKAPTSFAESNDPSIAQGPYEAQLHAIVAKMLPIDFWTTFERNFIFGYLFNALSGSLLPNFIAQLPMLGNNGAVGGLRNYMSVDGATYKLVSGNDDSWINDAKRYAIGQANDWKATDKNIAKNATLFGLVKNTTANSTPDEIGGKFLSALDNMIDIANSGKIDGIIKALTNGNSGLGGLSEIINKIKDLADQLKKWWDGIKPKSFIQTNATSFDNDNPTADKTGEIVLNAYVYSIASGETLKNLDGIGTVTPEDAESHINDLVKILTTAKNLPWTNKPIEALNYKTLLAGNVMDEPDFYKNVNSFIAANPDLFLKAKTLDQIMPNIVSWVSSQKLFDISLNNIFQYEIQGKEHGIYGIGLGAFFLTIGLYVGCILQTFIFDRAKRLSKSRWSNWYVSKWMLMCAIGIFQTTAEIWVMYACGWSQLGGATMTYIWLWMMFNDLVFCTIVQGLWFTIKDESIGRFLCVLVLVFSLAAGGGTFPAFTQFKFFEIIGYIVPFTYTLNGLQEIIYGISSKGTQAWSTAFIFEEWGILWIYVVLFFLVGFLVGARGRMKDMNYGSHYGWAVAGAMKALGRDPSNFQILKKVTKKGKKKYFYNWKSLKDGFDPDLYFQCRKMYKFEGEFAWWKRKHHDFVQKPNYSDEDTITRNE